MYDLLFTVGVGASLPEQVRAGFFRYVECTSGVANPRIRIKTNNGDSFSLKPGQGIRVSENCRSFNIENYDGVAPIAGLLVVGPLGVDAADSNTTISGGNVTVTETRATAFAKAGATVGVAAAQIYAANSAARGVRLSNPFTNTDALYFGHDNTLTIANAAIVLQPGEKLLLTMEAALALWGMSGTAAQDLDYYTYT